MNRFLSAFISALMGFIVWTQAEAAYNPGGGGSPGGSSGQVQYNNSGAFGGLTNPAALTKISSGIFVDPRNYGAVCDGTTFIGGAPVRNGSDDDTAGFEAAEFAAAALGGSVMVPDGCWVSNLQMLSGVSLVGQNWAPNYSYDYGYGSIGHTLLLTPGSGYTNGTYPLNALTSAGGGTGFIEGLPAGQYSASLTSSTSNTIGTGSLTFTMSSSSVGFTLNSWITLYQTGSSTTGNYVFGQVTGLSGSTLTVNVTQTGGSGTFSAWTIVLPSIVTVSEGELTSYAVTNTGSGYPTTVGIPIPSGAGSGMGGNIQTYVRATNQPFAKPVLYIIGAPAYGINWNGAETIAFVGFEINAFSNGSAYSNTVCEGSGIGEAGGGGKIWNFQMGFKGCHYAIYGTSCYDYLVSENSDYGSNNTGIGGCFSDFLSQGDTFVSGNYGISGSGGGFARIANDRFEYLAEGISPGAAGAGFLEVSINNTEFDHFDQCAIDLGSLFNEVTMTGGALKSGGVDGSLTVKGTASGDAGSVLLTVTSAYSSIHGGGANTGGISKVSKTYGTSASSITIGTGSKTFTTSVAFGLPNGHAMLIYDTATPANYMYGTITSNSGTSLVVNVTQVGGSGTFTTWTIGNPQFVNVAGVTGTTEANGIWPLVVIDSNHILLLTTTYANAYVSGGYGGVRGIDADVCMSGSVTDNQGITLSNVGFYNNAALGQPAGPAYIIETTTTGNNNDWDGIFGGTLIQTGTPNVNANYTSFTIGVENWVLGAPPHYFRQAVGVSTVSTYDPTFSINTAGQIGIGTVSPQAGMVMDMTVASGVGALGLPQWATVGRPGTPYPGMIGYNSTIPGIDAYYGSAWHTLSSVTNIGVPTLTSCGGGTPAIDAHADNQSGTVTVGTSTGTCTVNFSPAYSAWDHCQVTFQSASVTGSYTYSLSSIVATASALGGTKFDYRCTGN